MLWQTLGKATLLIQGIYSLLTALWAIVHIESFMDVSGYKTDVWLVKTVSILLIAISACLLVGTTSKKIDLPVAVLALTTSIALAYVDFYYALNNTISKVYMADGVIEIIFVIIWTIIFIKNPAWRG